MKEMDFPLYYRGRDPKTSKGRCEINECGIPVMIDGVTIFPGDYVFGDIDGVTIIPKDIAGRVIDHALETAEKEGAVRQRLQNGDSLQRAYAEIGAI